MNPTTETQLEKIGNERLVELAGGRRGLRGLLNMTVKDSGQDGPVLDFVASDDTLDRYNEVIDARGWDLANYRKNPVFQNSHKYGDILFTLGKSEITEVLNGKLYQRIRFAVDENPVAKIAYALYKGGFLNAVSVGFIPTEWENGNDQTTYRRKYLKQELLELSAVAIPANPNALQMAYRSGAVTKDDLWDLYEILKTICSDKAGSESNPSNRGSEANGLQLLQLARATSTLLGSAHV